jgi:hypothetical protein
MNTSTLAQRCRQGASTPSALPDFRAPRAPPRGGRTADAERDGVIDRAGRLSICWCDAVWRRCGSLSGDHPEPDARSGIGDPPLRTESGRDRPWTDARCIGLAACVRGRSRHQCRHGNRRRDCRAVFRTDHGIDIETLSPRLGERRQPIGDVIAAMRTHRKEIISGYLLLLP